MSDKDDMKSIWSAAPLDHTVFGSLTGDTEADVAVIGAGITGISTAYNLVRNGKKVIVFDSSEVGMGTTGFSTGNLYVPTGNFQTILAKHGKESLVTVAAARAAALRFIEERINEFSIDCGFKRVAWNFFATGEGDIMHIENERNAIISAGLAPLNTVPAGFPFPVRAIARVDSQAQFNPLQYVKRFAASIAGESCRIYEKTKVTGIRDGNPCIVTTTHGTVRAGKVVQATHTPKGIYAVHAMMEVYREYAVAARLRDTPPTGGIYWAQDGHNNYSIRTYSMGADQFIIVLDNSYKVGHHERTEESFQKLERYLKSLFSIDETSYIWAAQNYAPADDIPYIGTSPLQDNVYIATGFSADGLIYGTAASIIISDLITGKSNPWAGVFDPKRFTPVASAKKIVNENVDVVTDIIKDYFLKGTEKEFEHIKTGEGRIVDFKGKKSAAYRDEQEHLHVVSSKCTHMGCVVHWNNGEKSWDCPCHGSRFSVDGEVLEGPAFGNLEKYSTE